MQQPPARSPHPDIELAEDALAGDPGAVAELLEILRAPELHAYLRARGASPTLADDIIADLIGDCYGGERAKGGLHRLLGRYNGGCPLHQFFKHVALRRWISVMREKQRRPTDSIHADEAPELPASPGTAESEDAVTSLLLNAIVTARAKVDPEKLVATRLMIGYQVPQKRLGALLGWHESKISRAKSDLVDELRTHIMDEVRRRDPWLDLEWEDFLALCSESMDLFAI